MKNSHLLAIAETLMEKQAHKIADDPDTASPSLINQIFIAKNTTKKITSNQFNAVNFK